MKRNERYDPKGKPWIRAASKGMPKMGEAFTLVRTKLKFALAVIAVLALLTGAFCVTASAAGADVASAIENTWTGAKEQIKTVVNNVIFPALDLILAVLFFVKLGACYFDCAPV